MDFKKYIQDIHDFPKQGIVFKVITPLLKDANAFENASNSLLNLMKGQKIDKVVGLESRGFLFAPLLAVKLGAGFVPIRKAGKLPSEVLSTTFNLEYGTDTLEIH